MQNSSSSTLQEPYTVASYPSSSKAVYSQQRLPHVSATPLQIPHSEQSGEGFATITVESGGIHVMDLSSSHPVISYTSGPDTHYAVPAVSRRNGKDISTYAVIESSPELEQGSGGRVLWEWTTPFEDPTASSNDRTVTVFPSRISQIHCPISVAPHVLLVFSAGHVSSSVDAGEEREREDPSGQLRVIKSFAFGGQSCPFVPLNVPAVVVTALYDVGGDGRLRLKITSFREDGTNEPQASGEVHLAEVPGKTVRDISCDCSGNVTILDETLKWSLYSLRWTLDSPLAATPFPPFALNPTRFMSSPLSQLPSSAVPLFISDISLMHLNTTQILLSGVSSHGELQLSIWDAQYQALLASRTMTLPAANLSPYLIQPVLIDATQVLVVVSTLPHTHGSSGRRKAGAGDSMSFVIMVPFKIPPASSLLAAMNGLTTGGWLLEDESSASSEEQSVLQRIEETGDAAQANGLLAAYLSSHKYNVSPDFVKSVTRAMLLSGSELLKIPPSIQALFKRNMIQNSFDDHALGLVGAFMERHDWRLVMMALQYCPDISEDCPAEALHTVAVSHLEKHPLNYNLEESMELDTPFDDIPEAPSTWTERTPPPFIHFLISFLQFPATPGPLRVAMKKRLRIDDIVVLLMALEKLIEKPSTDVFALSEDAEDVSKGRYGRAIQLLQNIMDTFLLTILTNPILHPPLLAIMNHLDTAVHITSEMEALQGPLEQFARAHAQRAKDAESRPQSGQQWHKLRKRTERLRQEDVKINVYQVETLRF